jgi:RHS repeat-associated protein
MVGASASEMQVVSGGTTTTTTYIGNLEEIQVAGSTTTKIVYFSLWGQRVAEDDNTAWYYPINDGLTSTTVVVNYAGVVAAQLFGPYGQTRWAGGTMPTSFGFTGQRSDSATGLDYYGARSYDPLSGCFTSADTVLAGLNRYAYVGDNPTSRMDPSGHDPWWNDGGGSGGGSCPPGVENCNGGGSSGSSGGSCPVGAETCAGGGSQNSKSCGSTQQDPAQCSPGGTLVNSCIGKSHCVILINGGPNPFQGGGTYGLDFDIGAWKAWIDAIYARYGGDVGFILMETDGSNAQQGADLIHETLQSLKDANYTGDISLIGASAGAAAIFVYLNRADTGMYDNTDARISAFIAMDAPTENGAGVSCYDEATCFGPPAGVTIQSAEIGLTGWDGDASGAADYVRKHHISGVYVWAKNDLISSKVDGGGAWDTRSFTAPVGILNQSAAHTYIESSPDSVIDSDGAFCMICYLP